MSNRLYVWPDGRMVFSADAEISQDSLQRIRHQLDVVREDWLAGTPIALPETEVIALPEADILERIEAKLDQLLDLP